MTGSADSQGPHTQQGKPALKARFGETGGSLAPAVLHGWGGGAEWSCRLEEERGQDRYLVGPEGLWSWRPRPGPCVHRCGCEGDQSPAGQEAGLVLTPNAAHQNLPPSLVSVHYTDYCLLLHFDPCPSLLWFSLFILTPPFVSSVDSLSRESQPSLFTVFSCLCTPYLQPCFVPTFQSSMWVDTRAMLPDTPAPPYWPTLDSQPSQQKLIVGAMVGLKYGATVLFPPLGLRDGFF